MSNRLQLFVGIQTESSTLVEIDLYEDESIDMVDSIQDIRDVTKIYSPFSRSFKAPASKNNNAVFGHYYNNQVGVYDARFKTRAVIKIGGVDYKEGFISMGPVSMIGQSTPKSYNIQFSDNTISLKDKLKDDKLNELDYDLRMANTTSSMVDAVRKGLYKAVNANSSATVTPTQDDNGNDLYPDVIYAPIFTKGKAVPVPYMEGSASPTSWDYPFFLSYFHNDGSDSGDGVTKESNGKYYPNPVKIGDYRPSVKVGSLLRMIENKYHLGFSKEFMQREELDQMYLFHNGNVKTDVIDSRAFRKDGDSGYEESNEIELTDLYNSSNNPMSMFVDGVTHRQYSSHALGSSVFVILDKGDYKGRIDAVVKCYVVDDSNERHLAWTSTRGGLSDGGEGTEFSQEFSSSSNTEGQRIWNGLRHGYSNHKITFTVKFMSGVALSGKVSFKLNTRYVSGRSRVSTYFAFGRLQHTFAGKYNGGDTSNFENISTGAFINIGVQAPDIKIIDFVTGIFKLLNLTYYSGGQYSATIETIDEFYNAPKVTDLNAHVDLRGSEVSKAVKYKDVTMEFKESKDVLSGQYLPRVNGERFPDSYHKLNSDNTSYGSDDTAEGDNLKLKVPFSCMMYERLYTSWSGDAVPVFDVDVNHSDDNTLTDMVVGHSIDEKLSKVDMKNLLFFGKLCDQTREFAPVGNGDWEGLIGYKSYLVGNSGDYLYEAGNSAGVYGATVGKEHGVYTPSRGFILVDGRGGGNNNAAQGYGHNMTPLYDEVSYGETHSTQWWNPSNLMASRYRRDGTYMNIDSNLQSLQFSNANTDEAEYLTMAAGYVVNQSVSSDAFINGLYDTFYRPYLTKLYDARARMYKVKALLPDNLLSTYKMNDSFLVGDREFTINKANINIMNGVSKLELLTKIPNDNTSAVISTNALSFRSETVTGPVTFDLRGIAIYNRVFPNKVTIKTGSANNSVEYICDGLVPLDFEYRGAGLYDLDNIITPKSGSGQADWIRVLGHSAYAVLENSNGDVSNDSNSVAFDNPSDTSPPVVTILNLVPTGITTASITISATDNIAVIEVLISGTSVGTILSLPYDGSITTFTLSGLNSTALSNITVTVKDAEGNTGVATDTVTTQASPDNTLPSTPSLTITTSPSGGKVLMSMTMFNVADNIGVARVDVFESVDGGSYVDVGNATINFSTATFPRLYATPALPVSYKARTVDTSGNVSGYSNVVTIGTTSFEDLLD